VERIKYSTAFTWKKLYNPAPKTIMSVDVWTFNAQAAAEGLGSWNAEFTLKGEGGAGLGW